MKYIITLTERQLNLIQESSICCLSIAERVELGQSLLQRPVTPAYTTEEILDMKYDIPIPCYEETTQGDYMLIKE